MKITTSNKKVLTPSRNFMLFQPEKLQIEEQAESLTLSQNLFHQPSLSQRTPCSPIDIDKDKLYETFVLFQNFMNMNQSSPSCNDSLNSKGIYVQLKTNQISLNKSTDSKHGKHNDEKVQMDVPQAYNINNQNYDDRPVKSANVNFIELVEKNLEKDKPDEGSVNKSGLGKKAKTKDKLTRFVPKLSTTYQRPYLSSRLTEEDIFKRKHKTIRKKLSQFKNKDGVVEKESEKPRRVMLNIKYEQISRSLRKASADLYPYKTLTTDNINISNRLDKSEWKESIIETNENNKETDAKPEVRTKETGIESKHQITVSIKDNGPINHNINYRNINPDETSDKIKKDENVNINEEKKIEQETIPTTTQSNDKLPTENEKCINKEKKSMSNLHAITNYITRNNKHSKNIASLEIERLQSKSIAIADKLFDQKQVQTQMGQIENYYDKKIQNLNTEIINNKEEKSMVTVLKDEYKKLHHRLQTEIEELSKQKIKFNKWKEEEMRRTQIEKKVNEQLKKTISSLKKENQALKAKEVNYKSQIERLINLIKEMKTASKDKFVKNSNMGSVKALNTNSPEKKKINFAYNSYRNNTANKTPKNRRDISFKTQSEKASISNHNSNFLKKQNFVPVKPIRVNSLSKMEKYDFCIPDEYLNAKFDLIKEEKTDDGKQVKWFSNNKKEITFTSGVRKEIFGDGHQIVYFPNGDMKQIFPNRKTVYFFKEAMTVQTSSDNGLQVFKFQNGQIEKHFPEGKKEIFFSDGTYRIIRSDGSEETFYPNEPPKQTESSNV